ncbi:MAG: 6-phosphofructokinase [Candidatus Bathyarchaeota archaeon]
MKIGVVTSGGDAPGMNAAIRAIVRYAIPKKLEVVGIERGYAGLITGEIVPLDVRSVGRIINLGGTILMTSRCPEFMTPEGIRKGADALKSNHIDGLIVIGGDGSFKGALELSKASNVPVIGLPATIDNNVADTDETVGFDTAVNTAVSAIDKIRDTATSHERVFVVEVMGRDRGFLALEVGLTSGAGVILVPEIKFDLKKVCESLLAYQERGKTNSIIVAAEGIGNTLTVVEYIEKNTPFEVRFSKLGYIQRGGAPTARSRHLASLFGICAVEQLLAGAKRSMVGLCGSEVVHRDLEEAIRKRKSLDKELYECAMGLAV